MIPAEPRGHEETAEARRDEHDDARGDLHDADDVHRVGGAAGDDVVVLARQVAGPVVGQHLGELVEAEQDRRNGEDEPEESEGLGRGVAPKRLSARRVYRSENCLECAHARFATAGRPFLRGRKICLARGRQ